LANERKKKKKSEEEPGLIKVGGRDELGGGANEEKTQEKTSFQHRSHKLGTGKKNA